VVQSDRNAARFNILLALLACFFVLVPFFESGGLVEGIVRIAVEVTLVAAVWSFRSSLHVPVLVTAITALNELTGSLEAISPEPFLVVTSRVLTLVFLGVTAGFLSRYFWRQRVDVIPRTLHAEGLTSVVAISGQLFLAVLIGRLVGSYVSQRAGRAAVGPAPDEESRLR